MFNLDNKTLLKDFYFYKAYTTEPIRVKFLDVSLTGAIFILASEDVLTVTNETVRYFIPLQNFSDLLSFGNLVNQVYSIECVTVLNFGKINLIPVTSEAYQILQERNPQPKLFSGCTYLIEINNQQKVLKYLGTFENERVLSNHSFYHYKDKTTFLDESTQELFFYYRSSFRVVQCLITQRIPSKDFLDFINRKVNSKTSTEVECYYTDRAFVIDKVRSLGVLPADYKYNFSGVQIKYIKSLFD